MKDATTNVAGSFGARGVPPVLRVVEILAIQEARAWGVCSLNEFRKFMGLKRAYSLLFYADFTDGARFCSI